MPGLEMKGYGFGVNNVKSHLHAWIGNEGVIFSHFSQLFTKYSQIVNTISGMNPHTCISYPLYLKKFF